MIDWTEEKLKEAGYEIQNAQIIKVDLSTENYCAADFYMVLDGDGWGVSYGGYKLGHGGTYIKQDQIKGSEQGMAAILNIMWVVESDSLIGLKDKYVRVAIKGWGDTVKIIGHITKDRWFDYGSFFSQKDGE